jgi:hypothetical protein
VLGVIAFSFVTTRAAEARHVVQESNQFWVSTLSSTAWCQQISKSDRGRAEDMLHTVSDEVAEAL